MLHPEISFVLQGIVPCDEVYAVLVLCWREAMIMPASVSLPLLLAHNKAVST